jgi:hypothetical protein
MLKSVGALAALSAGLLVPGAVAQNPVPQIVGPVHPDAVAPGGGDFTLSVYGANFVPGAVVNWNYQPRATTYVSGHELQAQILSTDIAKNTAGYISVTNPAPGGGSSSASWAQVEVHAPVSTISVSSAQFYPFGFWAMAAADFTHDGVLDLVGEYFGLSFDQGVGNGAFQSGPIISPLWVQLTPFVYGDFNNDGNVDVAMSMGQQPPAAVTHMGVMLGDGKGGFTRGPTLTEPSGLGISVATGDFNRDGKLDLMTTGSLGGVMSEFLGNGDGSFHRFANYPYWLLARAMQVGDFNGDGKLDLALMGPAFLGEGLTTWIMEGNGDGTFQTPREILSLPNTNGCGAIIQKDLQVSDFNGDGKLDLAFCSKKGIGIMLGNGDGTFQAPLYYFIDSTNSGNFTFAIGDINSDGKLDLILSEYVNSSNPQLAIFLGNGDGTFQAPQMLSETPQGQLGVTVGDFNIDGLLDVIFLSDGGMNAFLQQ